jgi:hypothetical protein
MTSLGVQYWMPAIDLRGKRLKRFDETVDDASLSIISGDY